MGKEKIVFLSISFTQLSKQKTCERGTEREIVCACACVCERERGWWREKDGE